MVIQRKEPPNAEFSYKHALIRDAVYEAILKTDLVKIHKRIAYVIEGMYPEIARSNPGLLARHFTEGRVCTKAVKYWLMAGKNSAQQFALIEARSYLTKGLGCLDQLTDQGQIQPQSIRLEFLAALGPILMALEGSGSEVTKKHYADAVVLCAEMPESSMKFAALWGQWLVAKDSEDDHGLVWAEQLQELSRKLGNTELNLQAHHCHWVTHFHLGNFNSADDHIKEGLGLYDYACHGENASNYGGHDAKVCGDGFLAQILWFQGDEMAAQEKAEECYKWAAEIKHQASLLHALELNILLHLFRKDESQIRRFYRKLKNICDELDLPEYEAKLKVCCGMVKTYDGEAEQGIELMNNGLEQTLKVGTHEDIYLYGELIGEACLRQHHYEEGLECINRVIDIPESPDKQYWGAEIYRRKGELQQQLGDYVGALKSYEMAMDTAKVQHTRILGLRAAISLFRFNHLTGLCPRAVARLKVAHGDFLNGGSSPEQETARYLLSQIN